LYPEKNGLALFEGYCKRWHRKRMKHRKRKRWEKKLPWNFIGESICRTASL